MEEPLPPGLRRYQMLLYPAFAALGGLLGYAMRTMDAGLTVSLWRAVMESLAAGFVGILMMLLC